MLSCTTDFCHLRTEKDFLLFWHQYVWHALLKSRAVSVCSKISRTESKLKYEEKKKMKYWWKEPLIFPESLSGALPCSLNPHVQSVWKVAAGLEMVIHPWEWGWWDLPLGSPLCPSSSPAAQLCSSSWLLTDGRFFLVGFSFLIAYSFLCVYVQHS